MADVRRNDPCPCGSGRKYKHCCWEHGEPNLVEPHTDDPVDASENALGGRAIHPYAIARFAANPPADFLKKLSKREIAAMNERWSMAKVACLHTDDILSRLKALGIDTSRPAFLRRAAGRFSAWDIGSEWVDGLPAQIEGQDDDFICFAACELWKRFRPEIPSLEMLDDWVSEGYDLVESHQDTQAVGVWRRVWEVVRVRLRPSMTTFGAADAIFLCTQNFGNWIQDFSIAIQNAARGNPSCAETGVRVLRDALTLFPDEDENEIAHLRCDLGSLLFAAGRPEEGEATLTALIREHPRLPHGYVALADELSGPASSAAEVERAHALLETALNLPVEDAESWDIETRIADLKARLAASAGKPGGQE